MAFIRRTRSTQFITHFPARRARLAIGANLAIRSAAAALVLLIVSSSTTAQQNNGEFGPNSNTAAPNDERIDVLAVVNGQTINRNDLANDCILRFGEDVLESLINRQLVVDEMKRQNTYISEEDIWDEITAVAAKWGLSADRWLQLLKERRNVEPQKYREYIWMSLALRMLAAQNIDVSEAEIAKVLESEIGSKAQVRLIAAATPDEANQIRALAIQDPSSFGRLAREHSIDRQSAANSGMLPPIARNLGNPMIEQLVFEMQPGDISKVMRINEQYLIFKCEKQLPATPITPQQEQTARQRIYDHLSEKKLSEQADRLFERLQQSVKIVNAYNDPNLQSDMPGTAALVNGVPIGIMDLAEECITRHGAEVLEGEINRVLLLQELDQRRLTIEQSDVDAEIVRAADTMGYLDANGNPDVNAWIEFVTSQENATVDLYIRDAVWPSVALNKLVAESIEVTQQDIDYAWEANFGPRVEALAIVMQNERRAHEVWNLANQNRTPEFFGELAFTYSTEPTSQANYGAVPPINRHGGRKKLEDAAFALQPGEISGLVNVGQHWIILMCLGHTEPVVTDRNDPEILTELRKDIYEKKLRLAMAEAFSQIKEKASIDNFLLGTTQTPSAQRSATVPNRQRNNRVPFAPSAVNR